MNLKNRNFVRGLFLMAIAMLFGFVAMNYQIGQLSRSGPGLFPVMISSFLFLIGLLTVVRSHFVEPVPLDYNVKNIVIILVSLVTPAPSRKIQDLVEYIRYPDLKRL